MPLEGFIKQLHSAKTQYFSELVAGGHVALRPGTLRIISEVIAYNVRLAIVTTTTESNVVDNLGDEGAVLTVRQNPLGIDIPILLDLNKLKNIQQLLALSC